MNQISSTLKILLADIDTLISLTKEDIELVKKANHDNIKKNNGEKEMLLKRFESNKSFLNDLLLAITNEKPDKSLSEILPKEHLDDLEEFKRRLQELHRLNRNYAKFVTALNEFFSSLLAAMIPMKSEGYMNTGPQPASFLRVSV